MEGEEIISLFYCPTEYDFMWGNPERR